MNTVKPRSLSDIWPNQKSNKQKIIFVEIPPKRDYVRRHGEANVELIVARDPVSNPSLFNL